MPITINNAQYANGGYGEISYQWYKNGQAISGATEANYTPPATDATVVGANTYTRHAKDNACNTTFTQSAGSWVLTVICGFNSGIIAATGQTLNLGDMPITINNLQHASGGYGGINYQWYKNGQTISGAIAANYTPPTTDATVLGIHTYIRYAKDNTCNTSLTPSEGSWVLNVGCPPLNTGSIATIGQTVTVGGTPITINSVQNASGGYGEISYQWHKDGNAISGATAASYMPPISDASAVGVYTYTRHAKDNSCNTFASSTGSWILTVTPCHAPGSTATFNDFTPCSYSHGSTWSLTDDRDGKVYLIRYLPDNRYWLVEDLRYGGVPDACVGRLSLDASTAYHLFGPETLGDCTNIKDSNTPAARGYLYNRKATLQEHNACSGTSASANGCRGLCPPGFHVPTETEFRLVAGRLETVYGCSANQCLMDADKLHILAGGYDGGWGYQGSGTNPVYWLSSLISNIGGQPGPAAYYDGRFVHVLGVDAASVRCLRNY
jgi:uncharacterized protein (TIGR02145 family)